MPENLKLSLLQAKVAVGTDGTDPVWLWKHFEIVEWSEPREQNKQSVAKKFNKSNVPAFCLSPPGTVG